MQLEGDGDQRRERVGKGGFHREADHEDRRAGAELLQRMVALLHLLGHFGIAHDGACDQLGEDRLIGGIVQIRPADRHRAAADVEQIGDRLQDVERQTDRQDDVVPRHRMEAEGGLDRIDVADDEIGVFEIAQRAEIADDAEQHPLPLPHCVAPCAFHQPGDEIGEGGHRDQQAEEIHPPPGVEAPAKCQDGVVAIFFRG